MHTLRIVRKLVCAGVGWATLTAVGQPKDATIPFPEQFREWAHVKSVLVGPENPAYSSEGGIHHIYANKSALEGYRSGTFPDGSVIVYNLLETKTNAGITTEGAARRVDVMVKDSHRYAGSGGWGFQSFAGGDPGKAAPDQAIDKCVQCHGKQKEHDYVFSQFRK